METPDVAEPLVIGDGLDILKPRVAMGARPGPGGHLSCHEEGLLGCARGLALNSLQPGGVGHRWADPDVPRGSGQLTMRTASNIFHVAGLLEAQGCNTGGHRGESDDPGRRGRLGWLRSTLAVSDCKGGCRLLALQASTSGAWAGLQVGLDPGKVPPHERGHGVRRPPQRGSRTEDGALGRVGHRRWGRRLVSALGSQRDSRLSPRSIHGR